ncbi:MAG: AAA family ATPase [Bacteroidales bacterium]|nr:AAA family ATPase [Bacteroidales bacterium]
MTETNPQLELARRYVERTGTSLFLTGKAGTGKTTFLRQLDEQCPKRHIVVAPTGVAAVNARGVTIHSFFQLPFDPYLPDVKELVTEYQMPSRHLKVSKNKLSIMRSLELLIIDEISMVRADLLDAVDMTLRRARHSELPFGGVQLLMVGDVHQLAPVVTEREQPYMNQVYPSPFFFNSKALRRMRYVTIELTTVYRQQDEAFVRMLNTVRDGNIDAPTLEALNSRVGAGGSDPTIITLTTHNHQADTINRARMLALEGESRTVEATVQGNFPESMYPVEAKMTLKVGERVMFTKNDSSGRHAYYNGKLGTVSGFDDDGNVIVDCDDGDSVTATRESWENMKYTVNNRTNTIEQKVDGSFMQFPLRPAWAVTIHKAQGLTFDRVRINASEAFAYGQVYVALSRCRTLEGLSLISPITPGTAFSDSDVQQFCAAQPTFEQSSAAVGNAERQYYYEQLAELFGAHGLADGAERLADAFGKMAEIFPRQYQAMQQLKSTAGALASVGEKFMSQLLQLDQSQHAERIAKAADYYAAQLASMAGLLRQAGTVEVDNKETEARLSDARTTLAERLHVKQSCIQSVREHGFDVRLVQEAKLAKPAKTPKKAAERHKVEVQYTEPSHSSEELETLLSAWRKAKAEQMNVPAFVVLHQKTLVAVASAMPRTTEQLLRVPGMGRKKTETLGAELLTIINAYLESQGLQ